MKTTAALTILLGFLLLLAAPRPAHAQLVNVDKNYRVHKVDTVHNRLEVQYLDSNDTTLFVDVDGGTQVLNRYGKAISWRSLHPGEIIQVKGGLATNMHIHGKTIIIQNASANR